MSVFVLVRKPNTGNELVFTIKEESVVEAKKLLDQLNLLAQEGIVARFIPS